MDTPQAELKLILEWSKAKLAQGEEPPWAWYQLMKLRETVEAILAGMAVTTTDHSPQSGEHPGKHLRLVGDSDQPDTAQHRPIGLPVQPPM